MRKYIETHTANSPSAPVKERWDWRTVGYTTYVVAFSRLGNFPTTSTGWQPIEPTPVNPMSEYSDLYSPCVVSDVLKGAICNFHPSGPRT
mmetsp:Transcript_31732/g.50672  ORF Transcript_31732/g.50672 Transcript_31732/m.50672 type:complete len:90 (-) Transcript_31732:532-801(-)